MPEHLHELGIELKKGFSRLTDVFTRLSELLKEAMDGDAGAGLARHQAEEWYPLFGSLLSRAQSNWELWTAFTGEDGRLKSPEALRQLYRDAGVDFDRPVIAYCIIGVGSSFTHLVLADLLGHPDVRNYDGSWMEWGSTIGYPVAAD